MHILHWVYSHFWHLFESETYLNTNRCKTYQKKERNYFAANPKSSVLLFIGLNILLVYCPLFGKRLRARTRQLVVKHYGKAAQRQNKYVFYPNIAVTLSYDNSQPLDFNIIYEKYYKFYLYMDRIKCYAEHLTFLCFLHVQASIYRTLFSDVYFIYHA